MNARESISSFIKEYDQQGYHRTGSKVDNESGLWLINLLEGLGLTPQKINFKFKAVHVKDAKFTVNHQEINGFPLLDSIQFKDISIDGLITKSRIKKQIILVNVSPENSAYLERLRRRNQHLAIIALTKGFTEGLCLLNAKSFNKPYGPPVLQISSKHESFVKKNLNSKAQVKIRFERIEKEAFNILLKIKGQKSSLNPYLILTPRSGWWNCASERGGGLVIWYNLIKHFSENLPNRDLYFMANSGHELGNLGFSAFFKEKPELTKKVKIWFHIGANIFPSIKNETLEPPILLQQTSKKFFSNLTLEHLKYVENPPDLILGENEIPYGEIIEIYKRKGSYISILGGRNHYYHHKCDRWPDAINLNKTLSIGKALMRIIEDLD